MLFKYRSKAGDGFSLLESKAAYSLIMIKMFTLLANQHRNMAT